MSRHRRQQRKRARLARERMEWLEYERIMSSWPSVESVESNLLACQRAAIELRVHFYRARLENETP